LTRRSRSERKCAEKVAVALLISIGAAALAARLRGAAAPAKHAATEQPNGRGILPPAPATTHQAPHYVGVRDDFEYGYDIRKGSAAYAPMIGTVSGFVVTAVVLIFAIVAENEGRHVQMLGRATAFLVLGLIACLIGAFASAAVGAERKLTANLPAAALYAGAATAIGTVAITASFEILAAIYLRETKELFVALAGGTAIAAAVFVALILGDVWLTVPHDHWLGEKRVAYRWANRCSAAIALALISAITLYFAHVRLVLTPAGVHAVVVAGMVLAVAAGLAGILRTGTIVDDHPEPVHKSEVSVCLVCLTLYLSTMILALP
jgi:MFS family permease